MTTALGVDIDTNGNGVDPLTHRQIIKRHWNNTGIIGGLTVSGRSDLYYGVSPGVAVCSRGDADGYTEAYFPGGNTENAVSSGDGTYSRIDSIYLLANTGTPDNDVHCMVVQGTPAASPVAPTLPAGALLLQQMLMPAGASNTSSAARYGDVNYAIPYGAWLPRLGYQKATSPYVVPEDVQNGKMVWYQLLAAKFMIPTDRLVNISFETSSTVGAAGTGDELNQRAGSFFVQIRVDGNVVNDTSILNEYVTGNGWELESSRYSTPQKVDIDVNVEAGSHFVAVWVTGNNAPYTYPVTLNGKRMLKIEDRGVAQ